MKIFQLSILLIFCSQVVFSQVQTDVVAPYRCEKGKYGLANSAGDIVVPCDFDKEMYLYNPEVFRLTKENKFAYYSKVGAFLGDEFTSPIMPTDLRLRDMDNNLIDSVILLQCNVSKNYSLTKKNDSSKQIFGKADFFRGPFDKYDRVMQAPTVFNFDVAYFMQRDGLINLVDTSLTVLLEKGYPFLELISKNYVAVYENDGFKLLNYKTGNISERSFNRIIPSHNPEIFIINSKNYDDRAVGEGIPEANIINSKAEILSPISYHLILPAGENNFIGKIADKYYLLDKEGKRLHDNPVQSIKYLSYNALAVVENKEVFLYNTMWERQLEKSYGRIDNFTAGETNVIACFNNGKAKLYLADKLELIQEIEGSTIFSQQNPGILFVSTSSSQYYHYNIETKTKTPTARQINYFKIADNAIYVVQQDSTVEIVDINFNRVIGPIKGEYEIDITTSSILLKPYGDKLFDVYSGEDFSFTGERVAHARFLRIKNLGYHNLTDGKVLLSNGNIFDASDYKVIKSFKLDGKTILISKYKGSTDYFILNEKFENITPAGFKLKRTAYDQRAIENGLIVVHNQNESGVVDLSMNWIIRPSPHEHRVKSSHIISREDRNSKFRFSYFVKKDNKWNMLDDAYFKFENDEYLIAWEGRGDINDIRSYAISSVGESLVSKEQGKLQLKGDRFIRHFSDNGTVKTKVYALDGEYLFTAPHNIRTVNDDYYLAKDESSKSVIIDRSGKVLRAGIECDLQYFPSFELYICKSRDDTNLYHLSGDIFLEGSSSVYIYDKIGDDEYLYCKTGDKTKVIDTSGKILFETPYIFSRSNNYLTEYFRFSDENKNRVYISRDTFYTLTD